MTTDERIGAALKLLRGNVPQAVLATVMRTQGHRWSQATVWAVECGTRPLRLSEADSLAYVFMVEITDLLSTPLKKEPSCESSSSPQPSP